KTIQEIKDIEDIFDLVNLDEELREEVYENYKILQKKVDNIIIELLLDEEYDNNDCILIITAGAGGTDAQDWASMLYRMYYNWANKNGFKFSIVDINLGNEAGIKSGTFLISGDNAYGYLKSEKGVHRLVRNSPFNAQNKRHTSFALVEVIPKIDDNINIEIKEEDLKVETFKAGGAGGQHVNKNESAVRITHLPTGIVVVSSNERSQHKNKEIALKILKSRLYYFELQKRIEKIESFKTKQQAAWGNQIRNYILHPYKLVKDLRTNLEIYKIEEVLDGEINPFILSFLLNNKLIKNKNN
ncbi:MAG: peptide chain release factor 2, partial [bacterium]